MYLQNLLKEEKLSLPDISNKTLTKLKKDDDFILALAKKDEKVPQLFSLFKNNVIDIDLTFSVITLNEGVEIVPFLVNRNLENSLFIKEEKNGTIEYHFAGHDKEAIQRVMVEHSKIVKDGDVVPYTVKTNSDFLLSASEFEKLCQKIKNKRKDEKEYVLLLEKEKINNTEFKSFRILDVKLDNTWNNVMQFLHDEGFEKVGQKLGVKFQSIGVDVEFPDELVNKKIKVIVDVKRNKIISAIVK